MMNPHQWTSGGLRDICQALQDWTPHPAHLIRDSVKVTSVGAEWLPISALSPVGQGLRNPALLLAPDGY